MKKEPISEVYRMDCIDFMKSKPDKFFDLAIVDPEYGIGIAKRNGSIGQKKGQGRLTKYKSKNWDAKPPSQEYFKELFRVSKHQIIWGGNYFSNYLPPSKCWIVWDKKQPEGVSFAMAELAYTSFNISTKVFSCSRALIGNKVANNDRLARKFIKRHVTQKPESLYGWIYNMFAKKGWVILDTHLGSGTNRSAAYKLGYDFYATEIDEDIYRDQEDYFQEECHGIIKTGNNIELIQPKLFDYI